MQLYEVHGKLVTTFRTDLMVERASLYAEAIFKLSDCLGKCVGFIDGTKIENSRPGGTSVNQRSLYSRQKSIHCLVYPLSTPGGLIFHVYGLVEGRHSDRYMYRASDLDNWLRETILIDENQYYVYVDQVYTVKPWIQTAFPIGIATQEKIAYSGKMNATRIVVEWNYKDFKQTFASNEFSRKLQARKGPVAML